MAISNRYAWALADVSLKAGQQEKVSRELLQFEDLMKQNPELHIFYSNPAIPAAKKKNATTEILKGLGFTQTTSNFIYVVIHNHRMGYFSEIRKAFERAVQERLGFVKAEVTTATEFNHDARQKLSRALESLTGRKVLLEFEVDPQIIGGVITRIGDTIYDGSIRQQLALIKDRLSSE